MRPQPVDPGELRVSGDVEPGGRLDIRVNNQKLGEQLTFTTMSALVEHLTERMRTRGHYVLSYDDVTVWHPNGVQTTFRGDYVLLHALAGVPVPFGPFGV